MRARQVLWVCLALLGLVLSAPAQQSTLGGGSGGGGGVVAPADQTIKVTTNGSVYSVQANIFAELVFTTNTIVTGNGTATLDMSKGYADLATNANITISLANPPTTNHLSSVLYLSNSAASGTITISSSGFTMMTNGVPCTSVLLTNLAAKNQIGVLTVDYYKSRALAVFNNFYDP